MIRRPPKSTRTHTRCPATTLVRCELGGLEPLEGLLGRGDLELLALADHGAHHVGLAPLGDLPTDPLPDPRLLVLALRPRGDHPLPAGRLLAQDRDDEIAVDGPRRVSRDRRARHPGDRGGGPPPPTF